MGLEEILESRDTLVPQPEEPANTTNGKRKRKTTSQVWSNFKIFPLAGDKKKRCKCLKSSAAYMCDRLTVHMGRVI